MIGKTISHYKVLQELGRGGMGIVYKAEDTKLKRTVALKFLPHHLLASEEDKTRFIHEAQAASALSHPNIMTIYEIDEFEGETFISMELVEGETLRDKLEKGPIKTKELLKITIAVAEGLNAAHEKEIIHRDIKSENIMISKDGLVKIMDFGLARRKGETRITKTGSTLGTLAYMSPEQAEGLDVDRRSDLFSCGAVMYEMATGQLPFRGEHDAAILYAIVNEEPLPVTTLNPNIPQELDRIIHKALEKEPGNRYQHADDLAADLRKLKKDLESGKRKTGVMKTKLVASNLTLTYGGLVLLLILAIVGSIYLFTESDAAVNSIAVLPLENLSGDPEQEYFCDGLAEELINALTQIKDLSVVARSSAFSFKGKEMDIREIGRKLNVETVLEGSVRKAGNRLRITAQLINVANGYHLWSESFDRELADVFAIQDEIAVAITGKMKLRLLGQEKEKIVKRYTDDLEAYNLYLKGLYFRRMLSADRVNKGIEYFNLAIEKDPDYALAYAGLAYSYMVLSWYAPVPPEENFQKAKQAALKALELDDQLAEAYESLATVSGYLEGNWEGAKRGIKRAIELKPGYAWAYFHLSMILMYQARFDEAIKEMKKALELDPLNMAFNRNLGAAYLRAGQLENAIEILQRTIEMDPTFPATHLYLGYAYMQKSMYEEALVQMKKETLPKAMLDPQIGIVYARTGRREEALQIVKKYMGQSNKEFIHHYGLACLYFALEENDLGFQWLEKAYETRDPWIVTIKIDFLLDSVRPDPRFAALLKKMNLEK